MRHKELIKKYPEFSDSQFYHAFGYSVFRSLMPTYFIYECLNKHKKILTRTKSRLLRSNGKKEAHAFDGELFTNPLLNLHSSVEPNIVQYSGVLNSVLKFSKLKRTIEETASVSYLEIYKTVVFESISDCIFDRGFGCYIPLVKSNNIFVHPGSHLEGDSLLKDGLKIEIGLELGDVLLINEKTTAGIESVQKYCPSIRCLYKSG